MESGNDLMDVEFRKNRQLLWAILTPGEDLRGDNNDYTGFSFLAKTVIWHGRSNFNMLVDDSTMETHTYYRGKLYPIDFQESWYRFLNRHMCAGNFYVLCLHEKSSVIFLGITVTILGCRWLKKILLADKILVSLNFLFVVLSFNIWEPS